MSLLRVNTEHSILSQPLNKLAHALALTPLSILPSKKLTYHYPAMNKHTFKFHTDSGHGWLEVPKQEVSSLGVKPSHYSYQDAANFYLEEDCDLTAFMQAYQKKFGGSPTIDFLHQVNGDHPIRRYEKVTFSYFTQK